MVRTLEVVEVSPSVEAALAVGQVGVFTSLEQFRLEGPVEALELAEGLGMVWPAMDHPDSQLHQPDGERGEGVVEVAAPGRAIVHQYRVGHAVAAEDGREMVMDGLSLLVCTSPHAQGEPRMVVQYRQWVAPSTTAYWDMPLEVHLPKVVGTLVLEAPVRLVLEAVRRLYKSMSPEDGRDRALGRHAIVSSILEHPGQYVSSLGRVLPTKVYDELLHLGTRSVRGVMGALREIIQTLLSGLKVSAQPLVPGLAADPTAQTQFAHIHTLGLRQGDELFPLRHGTCNLPWHRNPPETDLPCLMV